MAGMMPPQLQQQIAQGQTPPADDGSAAQAPPDAGSSDDTVGDDEGREQASPEEQQEKDDLVKAAFMLIYAGGRVRPVILQLLDDNPADLKQIFGDVLHLDQPADPQSPSGPTLWDAQGPIIALAATGVVIMLEVMKQNGGPPSDGGIALHAGAEVLEDLAHISELAGKHKFSPDEMAEALRKGADLFREAAAEEGMINLDQLKQEFGQIVAADKAGQLNRVLPGLGRGGDSGQPQQAQQPQPQPPPDQQQPQPQ